MTHGLRMPPDLMRELAEYVTGILVERSRRLPGEPAWDGEFQQELTARPDGGPAGARTGAARRDRPGRAGRPVADRAARPPAGLRVRAVGADLAGRARGLPRDRLQRQRGDVAVGQRPQPARSRRDRLVPPLAGIPGDRRRRADQRRLRGGPECLRGRARGGGESGTGNRLHERPGPQRPDSFSAHHRHTPGSGAGAADRRGLPSSGRRPGIRRRGRSGTPGARRSPFAPTPAPPAPEPSIPWTPSRTTARRRESGCTSMRRTAASRPSPSPARACSGASSGPIPSASTRTSGSSSPTTRVACWCGTSRRSSGPSRSTTTCCKTRCGAPTIRIRRTAACN